MKSLIRKLLPLSIAVALVPVLVLLLGCSGTTTTATATITTTATATPTVSSSPSGPAGLVYNPPKLSDAPSDIQAAVTLGYNILTQTRKYAGKYVGNDLDCTACHFSGGMTQGGKNGGLSLVGEAAKYPTLHGGQVTDLVERVNSCFLKSENGAPPAPDSQEMTAIITYLHWVSKDIPVYADVPWLGLKDLQSTHVADRANGQKVFSSVCAVCHGANGQGDPSIVIEGVSPPPLFGPNSYNDAAGMSKPSVLAAFVYDNMPFKAPSLSVDDAIDVAAYVDNQTRPLYNK